MSRTPTALALLLGLLCTSVPAAALENAESSSTEQIPAAPFDELTATASEVPATEELAATASEVSATEELATTASEVSTGDEASPCAHHAEAGCACRACKHHGKGTCGECQQHAAQAGSRPTDFGRRFDISLDGYVRGEYSTFTPRRLFGVRMPAHESNAPDVGKSDGFALGGARLNLRARYGKDLYVRLGFDGATVAYGDTDDITGELSTGLKDAYFRYAIGPAATLSVGRFKPPYDVEELTPTEDQYFVHRSLESRGIGRHEGRGAWDSPGFGPGRQIGMMLGAPKAIDGDTVSMGYALALTNGNGGDAALNDNDLPALWARVTLGLGMERVTGRAADEEGPATYGVADGVLLGMSFGFNQVTVGDAPAQQDDREISGGFDVAAHFGPMVARGQVLYKHVQHLDIERAPNESALGGHLQVSFLIDALDLAPGVRYAYYDPRLIGDDALGSADFDRVQHITAGLRWAPKDMPIVGLFDYTHSIEQAQRVVNNDRVELALQVNFE